MARPRHAEADGAEPGGSSRYAGPDRRLEPCGPAAEPVVLVKKLADVLDGIEVGEREVGDRLCLDADNASLLVAEGWAERVPFNERRRGR